MAEITELKKLIELIGNSENYPCNSKYKSISFVHVRLKLTLIFTHSYIKEPIGFEDTGRIE